MLHESDSLEEISLLLTDHKSFCGDNSVTSEMFSPSNDFGFDSSKSSLKRSIRKSHRFSESRTEISRNTSSSASQHHSCQSPITTDQSSLSLMPEKINSMDESQLRESLQKSLLENSSLLEEVQIKDKAIRRLTECLNDIQVFSSSRGHNVENIPCSDFQRPSIGSGDNISFNSELIDCEEKYCLEQLGLTNQLCVISSEIMDEDILKTQESKTSLFEEFSIAIRESRPALEQNVITGTYIAKDILVGGSVGWLGAYLLRKFGTTALTAISGGLIVIHLAARKGYVIVNWGEIYKEIEKQSEENEEIKNEMEWISDKVNDMKFWIQQHKYIAGGLAVSFIYKIFK